MISQILFMWKVVLILFCRYKG